LLTKARVLSLDHELRAKRQVVAAKNARTRRETHRKRLIDGISNADCKRHFRIERGCEIQYAKEATLAFCKGKFLGSDGVTRFGQRSFNGVQNSAVTNRIPAAFWRRRPTGSKLVFFHGARSAMEHELKFSHDKNLQRDVKTFEVVAHLPRTSGSGSRIFYASTEHGGH
jgi:hypothetical protein